MGTITMGKKAELARLFWMEIERTYRGTDCCPQHGVHSCECPKTLAHIKQELNGSTPNCSPTHCAVRMVLGTAIN